MAKLPDPTETLTRPDCETFDRMASARSHADGSVKLADVYVSMFKIPGVTAKVGTLGEHLRFHGMLPDAIRELAILRYAERKRHGYKWSNHLRPAECAGIDLSVIDALAVGLILEPQPDAAKAALAIVDCVCAGQPIPGTLQKRFVDIHGVDGVVELVALCGLCAIIGYMATTFDIAIELWLPVAPF